jgi:membrane protein required for colicin V production
MNWADIAILAIIALSVLIGAVRGFLGEVFALAVWAAAFTAAFLFGPEVASWFGEAIDLPSARIALAYAGVFIAVLVVGGVLAFLLRRLVHGTGLSGTDRMLGLVFGLGRGAALVVALVLLLGFTPFPRDPWWRQSQLLPTFERVALWSAHWLPEAFAAKLYYPSMPAAPEAVPGPG